MPLNKANLDAVRRQAKEVIALADALEQEALEERTYDHETRSFVPRHPEGDLYPGHNLASGTRLSGRLQRKMRDLTEALIDTRRSR